MQKKNGLTVCISGSGGSGETCLNACAISGEPSSAKKRRSRCPVHAVLARAQLIKTKLDASHCVNFSPAVESSYEQN